MAGLDGPFGLLVPERSLVDEQIRIAGMLDRGGTGPRVSGDDDGPAGTGRSHQGR